MLKFPVLLGVFMVLGLSVIPIQGAERQDPRPNAKALPERSKSDTGKQESKAVASQKSKSSQNQAEPDPLYYSVLALGKNIPDPGYLRVRNIVRVADGRSQIDAEGNATDSGFYYSQVANVWSLEGSLSDKIAFLLAIPYVVSNSLSLDQRKFQASGRFQSEKARYTEFVLKKYAQGLQAAGQCAALEDCQVLAKSNLDSGASIPASQLTLASGESIALPASNAAQLSSQLDALLINAATPSPGATGLGDIDLGGSYTIADTGRQFLNLGLGFRLPTSRFEKVPSAQLQTGEGMLQFGVRISYDWRVIRPLMLSLQDQMVGMLVPGHRKKSSLLNPNALNTADPTTDAAIDAGSDGNGNTQKVTKDGLSHDLILRANLGLAFLSRTLQPFDLEFMYNRKLGADIYYDDALKYPGEEIDSILYGFKVDGLGFDRPVPLYLKFLKEKFLSGKNVLIAADYTYIEISLYQSF